ncbi:MAG TPA: MetQ/NlpA family ABC transporter substrate-binding protein [Symbiobacteriaceae bacterium]|nr:MetQ/NlpA family ABC transporter substrate-binding protein [Symbiobacteriaceae bacterium]
MKRTMALILAAVTTLGILSGCGSKPEQVYTNDQTPLPAKKETITLKIGQLPVADGLPFWVGEVKNYYKEQGINVELMTFASAQERDAAITAGEIDGMLADPIAAATLVASGAKVKIASLGLGATQTEGPMGILAAPKSGITKVEHLKGVEIAISAGSVMHYVTEKLLLENGMKLEEIKVTNIPKIPVRFESLIGGQVKAAILPDPFFSLAASKGARIILNDAEAKQNYSLSVIIFAEKALTDKAQGVKDFFIAYNRAVNDIRLNPQGYSDLLVDPKYGKLPADVKDPKVYKNVPPSFAQAPKKEDLESVVQWLVEKEFIKSTLTYEQLVDDSLLPKK